MTDHNDPKLLANWLDAHPGETPPEGIDPDVVQAVYALRPDLAPAPRVSLDDILEGVTTGPFAPVVELEPPAEQAFGGALGAGWSDDLAVQLSATYDTEEPVEEAPVEDDEEPVEEDVQDPVSDTYEHAEEVEDALDSWRGAPVSDTPAASDLDEVDPPAAEDDDGDGEATPVLGVTGTDPLGEPVPEATDPELLPIDGSMEQEDTSPSGRGPQFGVVDAPPPPGEAGLDLAPAEPPPSLRNRAVVVPPTSRGPLSSAGMPTNPPPLVAEDLDRAAEEPAVETVLQTDPGVEAPVAEVVDLTAHPRWGGRKLWTLAGTVAAAALVLFVVVPDQTLQDRAQSPGRMASEPASVASPSSQPEAPTPPQIADGFSPNQRLDSRTRAVGGDADDVFFEAPASGPGRADDARAESKKSSDDDAYRLNQAPAKDAGPPAEGAALMAKQVQEESPQDQEAGAAPQAEAEPISAADEDWDDVPDDVFLEVNEPEDMDFAPSAPAAAPSLSDESAQGDWGVASRSSTAQSDRERRKADKSEALTTQDEVELDGGFGTLTESNPGTGPEPPPPHELDALRSDAKPSDYRSDWYLIGANLSADTLERIRKIKQEADADTRADDYGHAASVHARLVDDKDVRVAQDHAGWAAVRYLENGDPAAAIAIIAKGKARGSANTVQLARLHYLEGKALEVQHKSGWAAESYRTAKNLNDAR